MPSVLPFMPGPDSGDIAVTQTTQAVALPDAGGETHRFLNYGSSPFAFRFGSSAAVTVTYSTGTVVPTGAAEVFTAPKGLTHVAIICNTGLTTTARITSGNGQ